MAISQCCQYRETLCRSSRNVNV